MSSPSRKELSPSSIIDIHVSDYYQIGDGASYENHYFTIVVKLEDLVYSVDRSYVDFVDLDKCLRKRFPKSPIMALPLEAASTIVKSLSKFDSTKRRSSVGGSIRDSLVGMDSPQSFKIRDKIVENISSKLKSLDNYVINLMTLHEMVTSDELMRFLDEEAPSMQVDPNSLELLSIYDLLLMSEPVNIVTVRKDEIHQVHLKRGQFIVWRFTTANYDIGFSVELNNEVRLG